MAVTLVARICLAAKLFVKASFPTRSSGLSPHGESFLAILAQAVRKRPPFPPANTVCTHQQASVVCAFGLRSAHVVSACCLLVPLEKVGVCAGIARRPDLIVEWIRPVRRVPLRPGQPQPRPFIRCFLVSLSPDENEKTIKCAECKSGQSGPACESLHIAIVWNQWWVMKSPASSWLL